MKLLLGDCLDRMKELEDNSVDAIVTDPPYGLSFMGKKWDYDVPSVEIWEECLRVLKPGGYLLGFAGTRTQHRMAVRIEDAGFEIRDMIAWVYGSGFPKSLNIGKAVDKLQGNEREVTGSKETKDFSHHKGSMMSKETTENFDTQTTIITETKGTSEWEGWGTALKPALEPITVARKPLEEKTVAKNCLKWGVGGINIDGSRVEYTSDYDKKHQSDIARGQDNATNGKFFGGSGKSKASTHTPTGRFPANLIHDGSDEVVELFPNSSITGRRVTPHKRSEAKNTPFTMGNPLAEYTDSGSAARFFYCAKASKKERNMGCEDIKNSHPTIKPLAYGIPS